MTESNPRPWLRRRWLEDAERVDLAIYAAIARTPTPALDRRDEPALARRRLLAPLAGRRGAARARRRADRPPSAAAMGLASLGVTATVVNVGVKPLARRRRPDRLAEDVPLARHVRMPSSRSFPSGHSAAAFAFATGVGHVSPGGRRPAARARRGGRLLARPHRRALPRRRAGRRPDRHRARAAHDPRGRPAGLTGASVEVARRTLAAQPSPHTG